MVGDPIEQAIHDASRRMLVAELATGWVGQAIRDAIIAEFTGQPPRPRETPRNEGE